MFVFIKIFWCWERIDNSRRIKKWLSLNVKLTPCKDDVDINLS